MTTKIGIKKFENGAWWLTTENGEEYQITSINNHCTEKLKSIYKEGGPAYITLEPITEYHSNEYRAKISRVPKPGWRDDDVACLVENQTGNLNPNAARDIAAATKRMKELGITLAENNKI